MRRTFLLVTSLALVAAACDPAPTAPAPAADVQPLAAVWSGGPDKVVTVMTRNLYLGADLNPVIIALATNPAGVPAAVTMTWAKVQATNFPARAGRLAAEIATADADLVGLQEVALWRTQSPSDYPVGNPTMATTVAYDFLQLLLDSLAARGAAYEAVAVSQNTDVEMPGITSAGLTDIRFTDRDVIIAKKKLHVFNAQDGRYRAMLSFTGPTGAVIPAPRGWTSVDVKIRGETFRFFNTHLETEGPTPANRAVQELQAREVIALLGRTTLPVIVVGDFNSDADGSSTLSYSLLRGAGLLDAWLLANPEDQGLTCCHNELLNNPVAAFYSRIDLVLTRGLPGIVWADVVGDEPSDRTPSGLWPSDHAGVVAVVLLK